MTKLTLILKEEDSPECRFIMKYVHINWGSQRRDHIEMSDSPLKQWTHFHVSFLYYLFTVEAIFNFNFFCARYTINSEID